MHRVLKNKKELIKTFISKDKIVLDVGFYGQGITKDDSNWPHNIIIENAKDVYGIDLDFDTNTFPDKTHYKKMSAEDFSFEDIKFDVIFVGDVIEHLSNVGLFLDCVKRLLKDQGVLIVSTPNCFNLWNMISKITNYEPSVNNDHTCYFNEKTIKQLFVKNNLEIEEILYLYTLGTHYKESWKKKIQNLIYWLFSKFTTKFLEPMVVIARNI